MKHILFVAFLAVATFSSNAGSNKMSINVQKTYLSDHQDAYHLACQGATGTPSFQIEGLPTGVYQDGNRIIISSNAQAGNYILRIKATDTNGQVAERIVNLGVVVTQGSTNGVSSSSSSTTSSSTTSSSTTGTVNIGNNFGNSGTIGTIGTNGQLNLNNIPGSTSNTGSNPNIITNGGNQNSQTPPTSRLNQIISTYSSITDVTTVNYPGNRFPEPQMPTGGTPNAVNPTTLLISGTQAQPSASNRRPITADDVTLRAASDRHQNAIKGITNLLSIIDQANANRNQAQSLIVTYTNAYNKAITDQRASQQAIITIQTTVSQITSAISNINNQIENLQNQAGQSSSQRAALVKQRTDLQAQITALNPNSVQSQINSLNAQIRQYQVQLTANQAQCNSINQQINDNKAMLVSLSQKNSRISATITSLQTLLGQKQSVVDDLQARLNAAIADRDNTKKQLDQAVAERNSIPGQIDQINIKLTDLSARQSDCNQASSSLQKAINKLNAQIDTLNAQLAEINSKIKLLQTQIDSITVRITQIDSSPDTKAKLDDLNNQLAFLRQQLNIHVTQRAKLYQAGNDANTNVHFAKQNLDAVIARFRSETNIVNTATQNLERARAEEALARQGLEELIAHYTNALPYAIVPNGNGRTNVGNPAGNNPSGSPLGPINQNGNGAPGSFTISSWTNYLSQAYGAGVSPAFRGSVTALYPFSFSSVVSGNNVQNNIRGASSGEATGGCVANAANQQLSSITGTVVSVRDDSFDIKLNDGSIVPISVAPCTTLNANEPSYSIKSGDVAVARGIRRRNNSFSSHSVTCLTE